MSNRGCVAPSTGADPAHHWYASGGIPIAVTAKAKLSKWAIEQLEGCVTIMGLPVGRGVTVTTTTVEETAPYAFLT